MTSELTVSEVPSHQDQLPLSDHSGQNEHSSQDAHVPGPGMGQSKSSRRRRRKRKNKAYEGAPSEQAPASGAEAEAGGQSAPFAPSAPPPQPQNFQPQGFQNNNHHAQNGQQNSNGKRWKKKFRDRDRQPRNADNIGNVAASGSGNGFQQNGNGYSRERDTHQPGNTTFKRKGGSNKQQQRGPRSFVGPMDHSYRSVSSEFGDAPPSTIESHNGFQPRNHRGYQGDSQPLDYSQGRNIPIPPDAPTHIYFFIEDLFFTAKIQETARKLGVKVSFLKNDKESIAQLTSGDEHDSPALIVFDLNNANAKPMTLIPKLKAKLKKTASIIGFLSHVQGDLKAKATEAGCDTVMPRAAFSQNLPNLLRRYGIEEEDEPNFNQ